MKKLKTLLLASYSIALLAGCDSGKPTFAKCEIIEFPKQTFYYGENFTNTGLKVRVTLSDGSTFDSEDLTTPKVSTLRPGKSKVNVYYSNEEYNIDEILSYEINVIEWTKEEKYIFGETSISYLNGIYYPKLDGMEMKADLGDDNTINDYWIEKKNATFDDFEAYLDLLNEYNVVKRINGEQGSYDMTYKFYEQSTVPSDFKDKYDLNDAICYKFACSYEYLDQQSFTMLELYGSDVEDTVVVGMNDEGSLIVRYIADSILLENLTFCEVNTYLTFDGLFNGAVASSLADELLGYDQIDDKNEKKHIIGLVEDLAPLAVDDFIMPYFEPDVFSISNYSSLYPWLHVEDDLAFEVEYCTNDKDSYQDFIAELDANTSFVKTTKTDKVRGLNTNVSVYTISNKQYVGNLTLEVTDFLEDCATFYSTQGTIRQKITTGCFRVYYKFQKPDVLSPAETATINILKEHFGEGNYVKEIDYIVQPKGAVYSTVFYSQYKTNSGTKGANQVENKEEAYDKFVAAYLNGFNEDTPATQKQLAGLEVVNGVYSNDEFVVELFAYFYSAGKYAVDFKFSLK